METLLCCKSVLQLQLLIAAMHARSGAVHQCVNTVFLQMGNCLSGACCVLTPPLQDGTPAVLRTINSFVVAKSALTVDECAQADSLTKWFKAVMILRYHTCLCATMVLVCVVACLQDGNPADWSATELSNILAIWRAVAEDYAPFDVDVTTEEPVGVPLTQWVRCVIGGNGACEYSSHATQDAVLIYMRLVDYDCICVAVPQ
jgi:hypothetical protein